MAGEQILTSLYIIILLEIGILILVFLITIIEMKETVDKVRGLVNRAVKLGDMTVDSAEKVKQGLGSASGIFSTFKNIPEIISMVSNFRSDIKAKRQSTSHEDEDVLSEALKQVVPRKKKRII